MNTITSSNITNMPDELEEISNIITDNIIQSYGINKPSEEIIVLEPIAIFNKYVKGPTIINAKLYPKSISSNDPNGLDLMAWMDPESVQPTHDNGYKVTIVFKAREIFEFVSDHVENILKNPEIIKRKRQNPSRYSLINQISQSKLLIKSIVTHELVHAFDPSIIFPLLKKHNYNIDYSDENITEKTRKLRYLINDKEVIAELHQGLMNLKNIIKRSVQLNYSNEIENDIIESLNRLRNFDFNMVGLNSLARIPFKSLEIMKQRNNMKYKKLTIKLTKELNNLLNYLRQLKSIETNWYEKSQNIS